MKPKAKKVKRKNRSAVALSKLRMKRMTVEERQWVARQGGLKGGPARAAKLKPAKRRAFARKAAQKRWAENRKVTGK